MPARGRPGFPRPPILPGGSECPLLFSQMSWGLLVPAPILRAEEPGRGPGSLALLGGTAAGIFLLFSTSVRRFGGELFSRPPALPAWPWLPFRILSYKASVQPDFRCFSTRWFCNLAVTSVCSRREKGTVFTLSAILDLFTFLRDPVYGAVTHIRHVYTYKTHGCVCVYINKMRAVRNIQPCSMRNRGIHGGNFFRKDRLYECMSPPNHLLDVPRPHTFSDPPATSRGLRTS